MKHLSFKGNKLGFTLTELLAVLAILAVLIGLGVTGFVSFRRNIAITEYDDLAREIYVAAQNQLTRLDANGMDKETSEKLENVSSVPTKPSDYEGEDWASEDYRYTANGSDAMEVLLPLGAVAEDVHSNGVYVIEYNVKTRTVYGVFYSERSFDYAAVSTKPDFRSSKDVRKEDMVGYYGGSAVTRDPVTHCDTPQLEIINTNELRLNILNAPTEGTFTIKISDGTNEVDVLGTQIEYDGSNRTVLLDGMKVGEHFHELFRDLIPGKDLTITVTYEKDKAISASASVTANSLFATREETTTAEGTEQPQATVTLAYARHLQNLENTVSNLNDPAITVARQTEHIEWKEEFGDFVSIRNDGTNVNLKRFEGSNLEIRNLKGKNGLFAQTKEGMSLSDIRLVNPVIVGDGVDPVGALVGTAESGTNINLCWVYCNKVNDSGKVDYDVIQNCHVYGGVATAGGLVGKATNTTVKNSFAALPTITGSKGAGLIGDASGCVISNSYAACDNLPKNFLAFVSRSDTGEEAGTNTVNHCYAVGNVADATPCFFINNTTDQVKDCYYAVSHRVFAENWEDNEDLAPTDFYYIKETTDGWQSTKQEELQNAAGTDDWAKMIAPLSHPYREYLDGRAYPYPAIETLDHYGSWPDGDGKVTLTIDMSLLNSEEDVYAIEAGRVVVTDQDGNILFDSDEHKKADGTFDGKDTTIQVVPGTQVTFEITTAEGYKYLYTKIDGTNYTGTEDEEKKTVTLEYTVNKDTVADVTFQQEAFTLTGLPAVAENGNSTISGASYSINLTSPLKTLEVKNNVQSESVETGSKVTVQPKTPEGYSGCVVWYTPNGKNTEEDRTYLTQGENGICTFTMPAEDTDLHVMYTKKEAHFHIEYYLMDTAGEYPKDPTQTAEYKCGLGSQINQSMINSLAEGSGLPLTIDGERVRYLAEAVVTSHQQAGSKVVFESKVDKSGKVTLSVGPHITKEGETSEDKPYQVKIYIARKEYSVTLTADEHVSGVRFGDEGAYQETVTRKFRYGAAVTAQAKVEPGYSFTYWDPQDTRFMMSAEETYTFQVPQFDLNLKASASRNQFLVTINLQENDESWLYSSPSRQADPISLTLVNSMDGTKYPMTALTEDSISYAMQAVVPVVSAYETGYYVRVDYQSGRQSWLYTYGTTGTGGTGGTDENNTKLLLYVRDSAVEYTADFYSVTYYPVKPVYTGSVPKGGTFPKYYHLTVEGNTGLLRNLTDQKKIFCGWKDFYAQGTGSDTIYTGSEILMLTRRTDLFAQWTDSLTVTYHDDGADGGYAPVDTYEYKPGETVKIQWGSLTRKGYTFAGWAKTKDATTADFSQDGVDTFVMEAQPLHLYPVWERAVFTVQFYDQDGNLLKGEGYDYPSVNSGTEITIPGLKNVPDGFTFLGWAESKGGPVRYREGDTLLVTEDMSLYACVSDQIVKVTFKNSDGTVTYKELEFQNGVPGYLTYVPPTGPVTAWSTEKNGKGELYFCREDGRSERAIAFTEDTTLYAVTGKVYNYNQQLWFDTLYDAVRDKRTMDSHTLIVYRDTEEPHNIRFNKSLYVIASGDRTVKWKAGATTDTPNDSHRLDDKDKETGEFVGCMNVSNNGVAVTVTFGQSDINTLSTSSSSLTFDANQQSRVISLGSGATFHMYDGVTLTNGYRQQNNIPTDENSDKIINNPGSRSFLGGGVYAGLESTFYMHGGTISHCTAHRGGGVFLFANRNAGSAPGSKMFMGDMVTPTAYSATAIYYEKGEDGFYVNAQGKVTVENYKQYFVTTGNPEICYNNSTIGLCNDFGYDGGGGGLAMLDLHDGDLVLFKGSINNNHTNGHGGGIITDGGGDKTATYDGGNTAKLRIYEVDISHNTADGCGGGVFQWQGIVYIYNSTLRQNYAAKSGGGIYLHHYGQENSSIEFHYGDIADNRAGVNGGGVYVEKQPSELTITHGNLVRNTAGQDGGGAYVEGGGNVEGNVYMEGGKLILEGGTVADNIAKGNGGGVCSAGTITMTGGTLSGNTAGNWGGGVYTKGTTTMSGGTICNNSARYLGGGIIVDNSTYPFKFSGGSLYGNTDTDYKDPMEDEDNLNPGPNDIYLKDNMVITIPWGGLHLSGEERVAVDCERDESQRFRSGTLPYRFAEYENPDNFKAADALRFTYYGTRSTDYSINTLKKKDLTVKAHTELEGNPTTGLYFAEEDGTGKTTVTLNLNYPNCPEPTVIGDAKVDETINLNTVEGLDTKRDGYYLAGWARTPNAREEQYVLYYDVVADKWRSDYKSGKWTKEDTAPNYTVQNLAEQTLYAMWRPCVVVYDVGDAKNYGVNMQATSVGPQVTILNPNQTQYKADGKEYYFDHWKNKIATDPNQYTPMQQLTLTENLRLVAVWKERTANTVLITFDFNSGTSDQTGELRRVVEVNKNDSYTINVDIHQANKILIGWDTSPNGTGTRYEKNGTISNLERDLTLYAVWADAVTLTYDPNGGNGNSTVQSVQKGTAVTITSDTPTRTDYTFLGWAEKADATTATYQAGQSITVNQNTTLYAVWGCTVTFDLNGGNWGETDLTVYVREGSQFTIPVEVPSKEGYTFLGWATTPDATAAEYQADANFGPVNQNTTLYAVWKENPSIEESLVEETPVKP